MARRCTTVPGFGFCCQAAQQNLLNQPVRMNTRTGQRCVECTQITRRNGRPGFQFRFHKSQQCGIGAGGCPALGGAGAGGNLLSGPGGGGQSPLVAF